VTDLQNSLLAAALLGTENGMPEVSPDAPAIVKALADRGPEQVLLGAWAVTALERLAGYRPLVRTEPLPATAPAETLPVCSAKVTPFLEVMLNNPQQYGVFLAESLRVLARKGRRAPHRVLPMLLDTLVRRKSETAVVQLISRVVGERGRWMAAQEKRWGAVLVPTPQLPAPDPPPDLDWEKLLSAVEQAKSASEAHPPMRLLAQGVSAIPVDRLTEVRGRVHRCADRVRFKVDYLLDPLDFRYEMLVVLSHE